VAAGLTIDLDATITIAHSEKENAAATWKRTYGLLTELRVLSLQFRERAVAGAVTVPEHDRIR
jgi:hypothetical protein